MTIFTDMVFAVGTHVDMLVTFTNIKNVKQSIKLTKLTLFKI
jgi:hypothetical protein